jgi:predicted TPR repeat methyltransferase
MSQSSVPTEGLNFDEALALAVFLQKNDHLLQADAVYQKLLEVAPEHPDLLHFSGVVAHQQGRHEDGIALIQRSLAVQPEQANCFANLGVIFKALGRLDEATAAYEKAIAIDPGHANAYNNLGVLLRALRRYQDSETAYRKAIEISPEYVEAYHNLGILLAGLGRTKEAVVCYCRVTTLTPQDAEARRGLAIAYATLGERDKAAEVYADWLKEEPDHPVAAHMFAACSGKNVPERTSDACVEQIFDAFASSFEEKLEHLSYRAPKLVTARLEDCGFERSKSLEVLDAGCGTGWCGALIAPYARRLTGVDLSRGMLSKAERKGVYDELVKSELTEYLHCQRAAFDIIVSADTLVYFGALEEVAAATARALRPGGVFIFTLEELVIPAPESDFRIEPHGRYLHSAAYVERVLTAVGLQSDIVRAELRMESGVPVAGLVVRSLKPRRADLATDVKGGNSTVPEVAV